MVRVSSAGVNPLTAQGDLLVGGGGSPVGYAPRVPGPGAVMHSSSGSYGGFDFDKALDADSASTLWQPLPGGPVWGILDLGVARRIGRYRLIQVAAGGRRMSGYALDYASTPAGPWTLADSLVGEYFTDRTVVLPSPITARYWRFRDPTGNTEEINLYALWMDEVATVGAGNPARLAAPPDGPRPLVYSLALGRPDWPAPDPANPDTAGAALAALETEVNELKATLRRFGLLAP